MKRIVTLLLTLMLALRCFPIGALAAKTEFDKSYDFSKGYAVVVENQKYGLIDENYKLVIDCQYDDMDTYYGDLIAVKKDGRYGFMNLNNEVVLDFNYTAAKSFSEGLALVMEPGERQYKVIDRSGNTVSAHRYSSVAVNHYQDGRLVASLGGHKASVGLVNTQGDFVVPALFKRATKLPDGGYCFDLWTTEAEHQTMFADQTQSSFYTDAKGNFSQDDAWAKQFFSSTPTSNGGAWETWLGNRQLYKSANGTYPYGWQKIDGAWYRIDFLNGAWQNRWKYETTGWYYFTDSGAAAKGWCYPGDGKRYYFNDENIMQYLTWIKTDGKWYYVNGSGVMVTGWWMADGNWYYFDQTGAMQTGWVQPDNTWYYLTGSGAMAIGWIYVDGQWYYMNMLHDGTRGAMETGWVQSGGNWYYLGANGAMLTSTITPDGYRVAADGRWVQ